MKTSFKRATVYLETRSFTEPCASKAVETDRSVSEIISEAIRGSLAEDAEDLAAIEARRQEPDLDFEEVVRDMKRRGQL
jgi:hypothetical protein